MPQSARHIVFALYPGFVGLDLAGPLDVFSCAARLAERQGRPAPYRCHFVARALGPVVSSSGLSVLADTTPDAFDAAVAGPGSPAPHTLVVPGGVTPGREGDDPELRAMVAGLAARARRVVSVCTGALLLAACGLLDGRRATTHWQACARLAAAYPAVRVEPDAIFVRDGGVVTSAGVTAGIDLALHLVEEDLGPATAMEVARLLVVYRRRVGNQSQFSAPLRAQARAGARFGPLHVWMEARLGEDLGVERLAGQAHMSPRHFARVFPQETGMSPARYVEQLRLDRARELLESGESHMQTVAIAAGFGSEERLRRAFQRRMGVTPSQYLEHFSG
ncbi:GlxA family transcriptional regulator [Nitratidesulfovibrio sp. SRB-5]|uniref:GlxA family transcriptional regulator n=1 Tax=Nitratidesulfovibrio sp. SRB-5 TaxID=2872636 RepID=UPI0010266605|nr:GlxA family transcriptional regulator [Nitratidesulfovibrio sp. SRB-5]MBZ2170736.1 GlxA family transcriptional regulator [Nitratidesulfovibrio sp. SRB-5]RXF77683.1 GlxA family transcriptional regulator [Desulfovibrio sp. DS-1]